jgi:BTB/POZ domain
VCEREDPQAQIYSATSSLEPFDVPDANIIIRSSDNVNFRVHKSLLVMTSSFFKDLFSLPQPSDGEVVDGLPVVRLPECSELLNSLFSVLYPVRTLMPSSYEKVLYPLATR